MEFINDTRFQYAVMPGRIYYPDYTLTLIIKGTFAMLPGNQAVVSGEQLYPGGDELFPDDGEETGSVPYDSDFAYFKPRADLLLAGKCHTPGGKPLQSCRVTFRVGSKEKSLLVFGNRKWVGVTRQMTIPAPFTEMDIRYENSYGGAGYGPNPVGKGYREITTEDGKKLWQLPNIENPHKEIRSVPSQPEPAGFGPLGRMWTGRFAKTGTYTGDWVKTRWPWFPRDFDWGYFNAAPADMQVDGYLRGDENLYFENLHPQHPQYKSRLPGIRVRCFLNELIDEQKQNFNFREVDMNLDTLWVDMEAEKLVLVWRGVASVKSDEYEEIKNLYIVSENVVDEKKPKEFYHGEFQKKLAIEDELPGEVEPEREAEPEPVDDEEETDIDAELERAEAEVRSKLAERGIDLDELIANAPEEDSQEMGREEEDGPVPMTREKVQARVLNGESFEEEDLQGLDLSSLNLKGACFRNALLNGVSLKQSNLEGADLTEASLGESDLSGANLKHTILTDADLKGANLQEADLSNSVLDNALFEKANLQKASLGESSALETAFVDADLTGAVITKSICSGADFSGSIVRDVDFRQSVLNTASFEGVDGRHVDMSDADITELRASDGCDFSFGKFQEITGTDSIWEAAILREADFTYSQLQGANFTSARCDGANFSGADLKNARFLKAKINAGKFIYSNLFEVTFEKADLSLADLRGSNAYSAEFLSATIEKTQFQNANLKMTKLAE